MRKYKAKIIDLEEFQTNHRVDFFLEFRETANVECQKKMFHYFDTLSLLNMVGQNPVDLTMDLVRDNLLEKYDV